MLSRRKAKKKQKKNPEVKTAPKNNFWAAIVNSHLFASLALVDGLRKEKESLVSEDIVHYSKVSDQ